MPNDQLLDHEFDGIREYDNPCPGWWHVVFWSTIAFSALYFIFFHLGTAGWTLAESYNEAAAENLKVRFARVGTLQADEPTLLRCMASPELLTVGASVFDGQCKSCHGADGSGLVGPNLTDDYYKNVKKITDLLTVVENGAAAGSMPAWRSRLHPNEIVLVAAYVASLRGKNKSGPRGVEGEKIAPWPPLPAKAASGSGSAS